MGVEEEMLLVDPDTGRLAAISDRVILIHDAHTDDELEQELFLEQIETKTEPHVNIDDLHRELQEQRRLAAASAESAGAALMAVSTPILPGEEGEMTPKARYQAMMSQFGEVGRQSLACGTHIHVEVEDAEAIGIIDDIRPWLPLLLALSTNSPFDLGVDTGYQSWRAQLLEAWPSAGPVEPFGDIRGYREAVQVLIESGAALDEGMIYFDVRVARNFPTLEVRVADTCTDLRDTVLLAEVTRAIVETAAQSRRKGAVAERWRVELLRAARWRARHDGLTDSLVDPASKALVPAGDALATLLEHVRPALDESGNTALVEDGFRRLLTDGTGAERQRAVAGPELDLRAVVDDAIARTRSSIER